MADHIHSSFDRDLETLQTLILKMGGLVEAAILDGTRSLEERDTELADTVRRGDKAIDALEEQINENAATIIALRAPVSRDLRVILSVIKLAASLERTADYAKNISKRVGLLVDVRPVNGAAQMIRRMARDVQGMLKDVLDAFVTRNADLAHQVILRDLDVDQLYNALFRDFITHMMEDPRNITPCMHLHFIAKNVERMGDLITNMAEQVVYLITGSMPEDDRPKGDTTSTMPIA